MGYQTGNLSYIMGGPIEGAWKLWAYTTADSIGTLLGAGYISDATAKGMAVGDFVMVVNQTTPLGYILQVGSMTAAVGNTPGTATLQGLFPSANAWKKTILLPVQLADLANAATWKIAIPFAFTVTAAAFRTGKPASTTSKLATLTVQVNGTPVTGGGVMALTTANQNATGTALAATAFTAATGTAGQTIEVAVSSVTAFAEGDGWVEFTITNNDQANVSA